MECQRPPYGVFGHHAGVVFSGIYGSFGGYALSRITAIDSLRDLRTWQLDYLFRHRTNCPLVGMTRMLPRPVYRPLRCISLSSIRHYVSPWRQLSSRCLPHATCCWTRSTRNEARAGLYPYSRIQLIPVCQQQHSRTFDPLNEYGTEGEVNFLMLALELLPSFAF